MSEKVERRVAVYCGSAPGRLSVYVQTARDLGARLARARVGLVYGGAHVGTMGAVADGCLEAGGDVIGVIPRTLVDREVAHTGLTQLHVVADMHERKAKMAALADAFIALPGGAGTMEELFEVWTWAQLELHHKPVVVFNLVGFYDSLIAQVDRMLAEGLMQPKVRAMLRVATTVDEALEQAEVTTTR